MLIKRAGKISALLLMLCAMLMLQGCALNLFGKRDIGSDGLYAGKAGHVCRTARAQIGTNYKYGGHAPKTGFDCSGLIYWSYKQHGVEVPRTAKQQAAAGRKVDKSGLAPGDIVVFKIRSRYHTGLYTGNNSFVHSPSAGSKVREDSLRQDYWRKAYVSARRVL